MKNVKNRHNRQMLILRDFEVSLADKLAIKNVNIGASRSTSLIIDLAGKFYAIDEIIEQVREKKGYHLTYDDCKRVISLYNGIIEQRGNNIWPMHGLSVWLQSPAVLRC